MCVCVGKGINRLNNNEDCRRLNFTSSLKPFLGYTVNEAIIIFHVTEVSFTRKYLEIVKYEAKNQQMVI